MINLLNNVQTFIAEKKIFGSSILYMIIASICILIAGFLLYKFIKIIMKKAIYKSNKLKPQKKKTLNLMIGSVLKGVIFFLVFMQILIIFGVAVGSILAVASIGSIAIGFGAQTLVKDFLMGSFIVLEEQFLVGDEITVGTVSGVVEKIGVRITKIRSSDGALHIIPNGEIKIVTNFTKDYKIAHVKIEINDTDDDEKILAILKEVLENYAVNNINLISTPVAQGVVELNDNSMVMGVKAKCIIGKHLVVKREIRELLKEVFDKKEISYIKIN